eukprot:SAG31_NODE_4154_length_3527_cov_1.938156_2_plen_94_part_00
MRWYFDRSSTVYFLVRGGARQKKERKRGSKQVQRVFCLFVLRKSSLVARAFYVSSLSPPPGIVAAIACLPYSPKASCDASTSVVMLRAQMQGV